MTFLIVPYLLVSLGIPALMTVPFYFFNKYLQQKINPRENGKKLLLYFIIIVLSSFIYITIGAFAIVGVAKLLK